MPSVEANGMTLEYDIRGTGEPILFVMGLAGQLIDWPDEFVDLFVERGYQAIRFDNRDIGLSSQTDWTPPSNAKALRAMITRKPLGAVGYTLEDMAADGAALLDALNIEAAHVVGASMGGMIIQEMAINHPEKVLSLCSIMSNPGDRRTGGIAGKLLPKLLRRRSADRNTAVDYSMQVMESISGPHFNAAEYRPRAEAAVGRSYRPDGIARQTAAIAGSRNRTPHLGSIKAPTLVIHGLVDPLVKPSGGVATAKAIPGARLLAFPDMGHDLPRARWTEMRDAIIDNIKRAG